MKELKYMERAATSPCNALITYCTGPAHGHNYEPYKPLYIDYHDNEWGQPVHMCGRHGVIRWLEITPHILLGKEPEKIIF